MTGKGPSAVVLGVGNTLCSDEGVGVHLLGSLQDRLAPSASDVRWIDGGTLGLRLLEVVESASHLLVLDAVSAGRAPGTLVELRGSDLMAAARGAAEGAQLSGHETGLADVLALAHARARLPEHLRLIGIEPDDLSLGLDPSPVVAAAMPAAVDAAQAVLAGWGLLRPPAAG
ncbi:MAG: hydrogenase maturation protease [Anaerolineae bacterium]